MFPPFRKVLRISSLVAGCKIYFRSPKLNSVVSDRIMRPPATLGFGFSGSLNVAGISFNAIALLTELMNASRSLSDSGTLFCW